MNTSSETVALQTILKAFGGFTCPECEQTFTDPEEWAYGHDCEG